MEKNELEQPRSISDYLSTVILRTRFFTDEYKEMAKRHQGNGELMLEIFMCGIDDVEIELLKTIENEPNAVEMYKNARLLHFDKKFSKKYKEEFESMKNGFSAMTREVQSLSGKVEQLNETIPSLEELFHQTHPTVEQTVKNVYEEELNESALVGTEETEEDTLDKQAEKEEVSVKENNTESDFEETKAKDVPKLSANVFGKLIDGFLRKRRYNPSKFVLKLYEEGYKDEQICFILQCMEEGLSDCEISKFITPKMTVEMMERLKKLYLRKEGE